MNIKQAKQEITNTLKAYLTRDEWGNYLIPTVRQRPILSHGPSGHRQDPDHGADRRGD